MARRAKFAVVIKTDSYAGNFEREMCAHLTGHIGECEVGREYADESIAEKFDDVIGNEADDNGCYRPVALGCDIKGFTNKDVVIFFDKKPTKKQLELIKTRSTNFIYKPICGKKEKILGFELVQFHNSFTNTSF